MRLGSAPDVSARGFDSWSAIDTPSAVAVLVVDDRPTPEAAALRTGVGPAVRRLASDLLALGSAADRATARGSAK